MNNLNSSSNIFLNEFYIPDYILDSLLSFAPVCPTIIFVNSKSGGQMGGELLVTYRSVLNENQVFDFGEEDPDKVLRRLYVFDFGEEDPDKVLRRLYVTLENLKLNRDALTTKIEKHLRIIVLNLLIYEHMH
ncbi:hypothetical protein Ccrd_010317, partial [Cynara cardunculus var. scolymus]